MRTLLLLKQMLVFLCLVIAGGAAYAQETDTCAALDGAASTRCRNEQQTMRMQQRLEQQLQQQQDRQSQLDKQQREVQQQLEDLRLQNESLRKRLEREEAAQAARPVAANSADSSKLQDVSKNLDVKNWRADNPWFGSDYPRTQFAMHYIKQLQQERPDLNGRDLLDALSTKVNETFGAK